MATERPALNPDIAALDAALAENRRLHASSATLAANEPKATKADIEKNMVRVYRNQGNDQAEAERRARAFADMPPEGIKAGSIEETFYRLAKSRGESEADAIEYAKEMTR